MLMRIKIRKLISNNIEINKYYGFSLSLYWPIRWSYSPFRIWTACSHERWAFLQSLNPPPCPPESCPLQIRPPIKLRACHAGYPQVKIDILWIISQTINKFLLQQAQIHQKHVTSWVYTPQKQHFPKMTAFLHHLILMITGLSWSVLIVFIFLDFSLFKFETRPRLVAFNFDNLRECSSALLFFSVSHP
jgi:hypothetical protein